MDKFDEYRELERQTKVRLFTCEAEILFSLASGPMTAGELQIKSKNSSTSFYMTLRKLDQMGLIVGQKSQDDQRRIIYQLAADLHSTLVLSAPANIISASTENAA